MKIKILYPNENGKLEFSKTELEKLLTEAYNEGFADGKKVSTYTSLSYPTYACDGAISSSVTYANANADVSASKLATASNVTIDDISTLLTGA